MSTLTSIKDGSLGAHNHMQAYTDGSLGGHLFEGMQTVSGINESAYKAGSLGCGCSPSVKGLGEYFSSGVNGLGEMLDTTPKKVGAGIVAVIALYMAGKKTKLIKNKRRRGSRRRRR